MSTPRSHPFSPYAALLAVQLLFGSLPVIGKVVLNAVPSFALVGLRVGIAASVLFAVGRYRGSMKLSRPGDYKRLAILSFFGVTLNQLLFIGGLSYTKAANTSLLAVTIPVFTLVVGAALGHERATTRKVAGIVLAGFGVLLLIDLRNASFSSDTTIGDLMIIANSLSYGIYVATSKDVLTRNGAIRSMAWIFAFAAVVCLPLGVVSLLTVNLSSIDPMVWALVFYIGIGATAAPYLLNAWALARVSPTTVAVFVYLQPLIGFAMAVIFLGERLDFVFASAAALIFAGVYFTTSPSRNSRTAATKPEPRRI